MGTFTRDNTDLAVDLDGLGQQHRAEDGGMIIALERWNAGLDTAEMFADLPDGACQEPHWGFILKGAVTMRYTDGTAETLSAGHAEPRDVRVVLLLDAVGRYRTALLTSNHRLPSPAGSLDTDYAARPASVEIMVGTEIVVR